MSKFNLNVVLSMRQTSWKLIVLSINWKIITFGLLLNMEAAMASDDFPQLHEHKSFSQNYEIVKLIDGPIDTVYGVNNSGDFIVQSGTRLWKVNASGEVIDYFSSSALYSSGLIIEKEGVIDWVFTGDKKLKPYVKTVDAKNYSEKELFDAFDQADIIEFDEVNESMSLAYLYKQGQAWVLDISKYADKIDDFYATQRAKKDNNLRGNETDVRVSKFENYHKKSQSFNFLTSATKSASQPWKMKSLGFDKKLTHRSTNIIEIFLENLWRGIFTDKRSRAYGYAAGYTKFELSRQTESIKFSVFSDMQYGTDQAYNFSWLDFHAPNFSEVTFFTVNYRYHNLVALNEISLLPYYENDVGVYAVRKKTPHNVTSNSSAWQLSYSGLHSYSSIWGHAYFSPQLLDPVYYWFWQSRPVPEDRQYFWPGRKNQIASPILKTIPKSITFHWTVFRPDSDFRLVVNGSEKVFAASRDLEVALTLKFDAVELAQAFQKLSSSTGLIQLNLHMEKKPWGAELLIHLQNAKQKILLEKTTIN